MIADGINANQILMFTFTNKAAREIKERVISYIGEEGKKITIGTYHSICAKLLRKYAHILGYENNFSIYDSEETLSILKTLTKKSAIDHNMAYDFINYCKNNTISVKQAFNLAGTDGINRLKANVYSEYQKKLFEQNAMDFGDLISNMISILESNKEVLSEINKKYKYIITDETQDSSIKDLRLINLLKGDDNNICMILDDEQSIYGFRGADIKSVLNVRNENNFKTYILKQNYRSTNAILNASRSLITNNKNQITKELFTANKEGVPVIFAEEKNPAEEANRIVKLIKMLTTKYSLKYRDIAILYRMSYISREIEQKLLTYGIPYEITGGVAFYARKEIKDILCYARLICNPFDFEAFKRAINTPKRGIGDKSIELIYEYARKNYSQPIGFIQACKEVKLKGTAKGGLENFNAIIDSILENYEDDSAQELLTRIITLTSYYSFLKDEYNQEAEERINNIKELLELSLTFESLEDLIQNTTLNSNEESESSEDKVNLLTMHASKGLEYKAVIIAHAIEDITPHWKAKERSQLEEERRLFYVAMTRAKEYLFITSPQFTIDRKSVV